MTLLAWAHPVRAAALAAALGSSPRPYLGPESVDPPEWEAVEIVRRDDRLGDLGDLDATRERPQQYAVPLPVKGLKRADKQLRHDRGMLAFGITFAALCGAGAGLGIYGLASPSRPTYYGQDFRDAVAAVTGLLACTVGALSLATVGAARLKKRRGR